MVVKATFGISQVATTLSDVPFANLIPSTTITGSNVIPSVNANKRFISLRLEDILNTVYMPALINSFKGISGVKYYTFTTGSRSITISYLGKGTYTPSVSSSVAGIFAVAYNRDNCDILSVYVSGTTADLDVDNSFKVSFSLVGAVDNKIYTIPTVQKIDRITGQAASTSIPYTIDVDNTPGQRVYSGGIVGTSTSVGIQIINLNAFVNWGIKLVF